LRYDLVAFDTLGGKLVFITLGTINVMFFGDEGFCANWIVTCATNETFFVPLSSLVFHFLHSCSEDISTSIASGGKLSVVTWSTIYSVGFGTKLFVHQRSSAFGTDETSLVPVFFFIRQVLGINSDDFATLIAIIGEYIFVAFDTIRMIVT
jgi:hypothetical protein